MSFKTLPVSRSGVELEKQYALRDVQHGIIERGKKITINFHNKETITRDRFNNIIKREISAADKLITYAYPVIFDPTQKEQDKAGIREVVQCIAYTATQEWIENGFTINQLKKIDSIGATAVIDKQKFEIKTKNYFSDFSDEFLYVILGLNKI